MICTDERSEQWTTPTAEANLLQQNLWRGHPWSWRTDAGTSQSDGFDRMQQEEPLPAASSMSNLDWWHRSPSCSLQSRPVTDSSAPAGPQSQQPEVTQDKQECGLQPTAQHEQHASCRIPLLSNSALDPVLCVADPAQPAAVSSVCLQQQQANLPAAGTGLLDPIELESMAGFDPWDTALDSLMDFSELTDISLPGGTCCSADHHPTSEHLSSSDAETAGPASAASLSTQDSVPISVPIVADFRLCNSHKSMGSVPEESPRKGATVKAERHRGRGRPRIYDTSVATTSGSYASEAGEEPNLLAKKKRGAKPKYKYGTEAEALAMRRERNRNTAISSYYKRKAHTEQLLQEIEHLITEQKALKELDKRSQSVAVSSGRLGELLRKTGSGIQTLELMNKTGQT